jgi:hypothetical protein
MKLTGAVVLDRRWRQVMFTFTVRGASNFLNRSGTRREKETAMRKLILFAAVATFVVAATGVVIPAVAKEKSKAVATGQKMKLKGVVTRRDADTFTVRSKKGGKSSGGVSEPPPNLSAADKAKTRKKRRESVQFEDIHVGKEVDKSSPKLNPASGPTEPGGGKPPGGGLLDSQGGLGTTGPAGAGTGAPRGGGAAPGPVFR